MMNCSGTFLEMHWILNGKNLVAHNDQFKCSPGQQLIPGATKIIPCSGLFPAQGPLSLPGHAACL